MAGLILQPAHEHWVEILGHEHCWKGKVAEKHVSSADNKPLLSGVQLIKPFGSDDPSGV